MDSVLQDHRNKWLKRWALITVSCFVALTIYYTVRGDTLGNAVLSALVWSTIASSIFCVVRYRATKGKASQALVCEKLE